MAEDYRFIFEKLGELVRNSHDLAFKRFELLEIYSVENEIENFLERYLKNNLADRSNSNLIENLENHVDATFNYYEALIEKRSLLKVFEELALQKVSEERSASLKILFGNLDEENSCF